MALVLRKAVLSKNVSLLKCIKGRSIAVSTATKKNPTPWTPYSIRSPKLQYLPIFCTKLPEPLKVTETTTAQPKRRARLSTSCPNLTLERKVRDTSLPRTRSCFLETLGKHSQPVWSRAYSTKPSCPPSCPPSSCGNCLPPPCPQNPPQCIQCMTGYYYYPYGFWFCGPYHVTCKPVPDCKPCVSCCPPCCVCPNFNPQKEKAKSNRDYAIKVPMSDVQGFTEKEAQPVLPITRNGISKFFSFVQPKKTKDIPPALSSLLCLGAQKSDCAKESVDRKHYSTVYKSDWDFKRSQSRNSSAKRKLSSPVRRKPKVPAQKETKKP